MIKKIFEITVLIGILTISINTAYADKIEDVLKTVNNPLDSLADRKKAVQEIKSNKDPRVLTSLIDVIKNSAEPITYRAYVVDVLMQSTDQWPIIELTNIARDPKLPAEVRKPPLYSLWMKDPQKFKPDVIKIAQNSAEPVDLRVTALTYLRTSGDTKLPISFWKNLLGKNNDTQIRIAALNGMEQLGFLSQEKNSLIQIMQNPSEEISIRKTSILNAERFFSAEEVVPELIHVISRADNPLEMRQFALNHLASYSFTDVLPQLEKILLTEKNPTFRKDLKSLIETAGAQN